MVGSATPAWRSPSLPVTLGISACLLGEEVRYDGGHQKDDYVTGELSRHFRWVSVCPEMEIGLGAPRETLRLVGEARSPRMVGSKSGADHTDAMNAYARRRVGELADAGLSGYLLKRASPSCGMERVKVYPDERETPTRSPTPPGPSGVPRPGRSAPRPGRGLFASALLEAFPLLPVEEEGRLNDPVLRDSFITRVFAYRRFTALRESDPRPADIVDFHTAHKYLLLSHSEVHYRALGRLVAAVTGTPRGRFIEEYGSGFMRALAVRATPKKHVNVLQHITGFFKTDLGPADKRELLGLIDDFARGLVPLIVPITLINHHVSRFEVAYVADQVYLRPHPKELMLRNHI